MRFGSFCIFYFCFSSRTYSIQSYSLHISFIVGPIILSADFFYCDLVNIVPTAFDICIFSSLREPLFLLTVSDCERRI